MAGLATAIGRNDGAAARLIRRPEPVRKTLRPYRDVFPESADDLTSRLGIRVRLDDTGEALEESAKTRALLQEIAKNTEQGLPAPYFTAPGTGWATPAGYSDISPTRDLSELLEQLKRNPLEGVTPPAEEATATETPLPPAKVIDDSVATPDAPEPSVPVALPISGQGPTFILNGQTIPRDSDLGRIIRANSGPGGHFRASDTAARVTVNLDSLSGAQKAKKTKSGQLRGWARQTFDHAGNFHPGTIVSQPPVAGVSLRFPERGVSGSGKRRKGKKRATAFRVAF